MFEIYKDRNKKSYLVFDDDTDRDDALKIAKNHFHKPIKQLKAEVGWIWKDGLYLELPDRFDRPVWAVSTKTKKGR